MRTVAISTAHEGNSVELGTRPLTRFVKLFGQNRSLVILDSGRRPVFSLRAVDNVVIALSHPTGHGMAVDTLACPTTQSLTYEGAKSMEVLADDKILLRNSNSSCLLDCGANRVILSSTFGGHVTRYVRNLQLWVFERSESALQRSRDTAYTNPIDLSRLRSGAIIMSGPLLIAKPYSRDQTIDSVGLLNLAGVPWLAAFAAGAAMLQHFGDDVSQSCTLSKPAIACLGDAAVICAIMHTLTDITRYLRGVSQEAMSNREAEPVIHGDLRA